MPDKRKLDKGPLAGYTVELAPQEKVEIYSIQVRRVLEALGYEHALVTDMSSISDFRPTPKEIQELVTALGVPVDRKDYIWEIAERLFMRDTEKQ